VELFSTLVQYGGLAFALVTVALVAILRGDVVTRRAYDAMCIEKDRQISREQDRSADLWLLVRPQIQVAHGALNELEAGGKTRR
jgi:hypothetical protein